MILKVDGWDRPISCWKKAGHGAQNLAQVLQNSCNPAIMNIGFSLGQTRFTEYVEAFGLRDKSGIELTGEAKVLVSRTFRPTEVYLVAACYYLAMVSAATWLLAKLEQKLAIPGFGPQK